MTNKLQKILWRGQGARDLFESKAFTTAYEEVRQELVNELLKTKMKDVDGREKAYLAVRTLDQVVTRLKAYISEYEYELKREKDKKKSKTGRKK